MYPRGDRIIESTALADHIGSSRMKKEERKDRQGIVEDVDCNHQALKIKDLNAVNNKA